MINSFSKSKLCSIFKRRYSTSNTKNEIYFFGLNDNYQFFKDQKKILNPRRIDFECHVKDISCGWGHIMIVDNNGKIYGWGENDKKQLSNLKNTEKPNIIDSLKDYNISMAACGSAHSLVLTDKCEVLSFGSNKYGQLGNGQYSEDNLETPYLIDTLKGIDIKKISCGNDHSLALSKDGTVWSWGIGQEGQNGVIDEDLCYPEAIEDIDKIIDISCGLEHSMALSEDGSIWYWGSTLMTAESLQYSLESQIVSVKPRCIGIINKKATKIASGGVHNLILCEDGNVYSWGEGFEGRLGHKSEEKCSHPKLIEYFRDNNIRIKDIATKGGHNLALSEGGDLYSWGYGSDGRLGNLSDDNQYVPKKVEFFKGKKITNFVVGIDYSLVVCEIPI